MTLFRDAEVEDPVLLDRSRHGDLVALGALYDRHSAALFTLACELSQSSARADAAVLTAFQSAITDAASTTATRVRHDLAQRVVDSCRPAEWLDQPSALWALVTHGDHTYREAAHVLGLDPGVVADLLLATLRGTIRLGDQARMSAVPGTETPGWSSGASLA